MSSAAAGSHASPPTKPEKIDPVLRNALRYTISPKEYQLLHQYLLSRAPAVRKRTLPPKRYNAITQGGDDYNAAAIRASLRLAVVTFSGMKAWELVSTRLLNRGATHSSRRQRSLWRSPNIRLPCSLSLILLFHRLLGRFIGRLRESLLQHKARSFRRRNPRISATLISPLAPAIGSSLAGFFLAVYPGDQLRVTIAIYIFTRACEFGYNFLDDLGYFRNRPAWFGSWMLVPISCGQPLHAFVFDRDCFPASWGNQIMEQSSDYIQKKPSDYPDSRPWPGTYDIVDSLADISKARWPPFISPILFPSMETVPKGLTKITPITSSAHPAIKNLSCALLHPNEPSCMRMYVSYWTRAFPKVARFLTIVLAAMSLPNYKSFLDSPIMAVNRLAKSILRMSLFVCGAIGTSWGSICLFQNILPRLLLPTQRWFLGGFLGGIWAFLERKHGRANFLYLTRMSIDSFWKVGIKRGWWRGIKNGDVLLFVLSLATVNALYEVSPKAVSSGVARKGLGVLRGEGWVDRASLPQEKESHERKDANEDEDE